MDFTSKFITTIVNAGVIPADIGSVEPSDRFKRIRASGDKRGKRSISYWLKLEYDFAYGYAKDFKTGAEVRFNSWTDDPGFSRQDIGRIKKLLKIRKAEEDLAIADRQAKIAERAKIVWSRCKNEGTTPYLTTKGIHVLSAGIQGQDVFVPIYDAGGLVSWQKIMPDGTKRFPFGGKKQGCWHVIGQIDPTKEMIICEGFATGASINMALGKPVVIAFDAGNLLPVSKALRNIYKNTSIIIAADNDENGVGLKSAQQVKKTLANVSIVMPKETNNDFNDLLPDAIKLAFQEGAGGFLSPLAVSQHSLENPTASRYLSVDWMSQLSLDDKSRIVSSSLKNAILYLLHHDDFKGVFAFDEFKQRTLLVKCPPWESGKDFKVREVDDTTITQVAACLEDYGLNSSIDRTYKAMQVVAIENKFHSARRYFDTLVWDSRPRLGDFFSKHFGSKSEDKKYLELISKKWFTAIIKRLYEPGCKFDHILILESQKQGLYKSSALKALATFNGETYHTDGISMTAIEGQYTSLKMHGNIIVELAELSGFSKKEDNVIKNWITQTIDEVKLPYDRKITKYPRQFVFAATTNEFDYLKDPTGNRRFWPVTVEKYIDIEEMEKEKDQIWAEAVQFYKAGFYIGLTPEENDLADIERQKRMNQDAWQEMILTIVGKNALDEFRTTHILEKMDLRTNEKNEKTLKRIGSILRMNGYQNLPVRNNATGKVERLWSRSVQ